MLASQLRLLNKPTASLQSGKTPTKQCPDMTLKHRMFRL